MLTIQPLTFDRIAYSAAMLCDADLEELDAAGIEDALSMLRDAVPSCLWAEEALWRGEPVAVFGVRPLPGGEIGVPWMLTTQRMEDAGRAAVARAAVRAVRRMRAEFPVLVNWVHARNERAIRLVEWLGFTVSQARCGPGAAFREFMWRRDDV